MMAHDIIFSLICFAKLYHRLLSAKLGAKAEPMGKFL